MIQLSPMLCLITHIQNSTLKEYLTLLEQAIASGVTHVQFRAKSMNRFETYVWAHSIKKFLTARQIPLIMNDSVALAEIVNADGVHLGQTDGSPEAARARLGPDKCIGLTIESLQELDAANQLNCIDYVAASAVFPTQSKNNCKKIWGLNGLGRFVQQSKHPVVAVGGIQTNNITNVMRQGVIGVAVISAIQLSDTIQKTTQYLRGEIDDAISARYSTKAVEPISS